MPSRPSMQITQDWTPIIVHKRRPQKASDAVKAKVVQDAIRAGAKVETIKKFEAGRNKNKKSEAPLNSRKLDEETGAAVLNKVSAEVRQAIQKARTEKKLSQAELGKRINERPQVIQEYETGKAVPDHFILSKMEKILGVKLRGKLNSH